MVVAGSSQSFAGRRWELTERALQGLLARLDTNPVVAGEKYEHLRRALLKFFSWHQMPEAESSADETLDRIARRLDAGHTIDDITGFAHGVAKLVSRERQRRAAPMLTAWDERLVANAVASSSEDEVRDACLQHCLAALSPQDRDLIVAYYVGTGRGRIDGRARLAAALGVTENALRLRVQRLRDHLRGCAKQFLGQDGSVDVVWPNRH
jgi:DNA-directed RNA polymerase specialized sigma24 family protein